MTPKLEIHPADGDFVAATYTLDKTASVTGRGFSAFDAVANLRVYLQPFGYELPWIEISQVRVGTVSPDGVNNREQDAVLAAAAKSVEYRQPDSIYASGAQGAKTFAGRIEQCSSGTTALTNETSKCCGNAQPLAPNSPISECESAVDRVFKQHLGTGRN